jgi:hypothetical protein
VESERKREKEVKIAGVRVEGKEKLSINDVFIVYSINGVKITLFII